MKAAIIDLGTNTFHLIIADLKNLQNPILYKTQIPVKLGEGMVKDNKIIPSAYQRGMACLKDFKMVMEQWEIQSYIATGTACLRTAINGNNFVQDVFQQYGIAIQIISGEEEAQLIYEGVKWSGVISERSLIMDIGGGSTEFMICDTTNLLWKKSYPIGASRLMQLFFHSDPINEIDKNQLIDHLKTTLKDLFEELKKNPITTLIGSAGAFESFAAMTNTPIEKEYASINLHSFLSLAKRLEQSTHEDRAKIDNLIPLRVDMIVMASILTQFIIGSLAIQQLKISSFDLKMGLLQRKLMQFHT
ncbi:MAG: exopolyphosphatase [Pedobacter sp.]|nr:MAG: exopolyphosphatase [Pedobacter sp.]